MSAELYSASGNNVSLPGITVGGTKPLHRFIKGQPKIIGIIVLILGSSFFIISITVTRDSLSDIWVVVPPGIVLGILFIVCGILYIVTEHNTTKKTVTISLALSIVTLLGTCWTILHLAAMVVHVTRHIYDSDEMLEFYADNTTEAIIPWSFYSEVMDLSLVVLYLFYSVVGAVILIAMTTLAGAALRSTKSQAIVTMTTTTPDTPVE